MFGTIFKIEQSSITLIVHECCSVRLERIHRENLNAPMVVGLRVWYEVIAGETILFKSIFDNCSRCLKIQRIADIDEVFHF